MNIGKEICSRKLLVPLQYSNRILINEKFKFSVMGGLSSNTFFFVDTVTLNCITYEIINRNESEDARKIDEICKN